MQRKIQKRAKASLTHRGKRAIQGALDQKGQEDLWDPKDYFHDGFSYWEGNYENPRKTRPSNFQKWVKKYNGSRDP